MVTALNMTATEGLTVNTVTLFAPSIAKLAAPGPLIVRLVALVLPTGLGLVATCWMVNVPFANVIVPVTLKLIVSPADPYSIAVRSAHVLTTGLLQLAL